MLNGLVKSDVQWTDKSIVNRLHERGHANKVSMKKGKRKKKERREAGDEADIYTLVRGVPRSGLDASPKKEISF